MDTAVAQLCLHHIFMACIMNILVSRDRWVVPLFIIIIAKVAIAILRSGLQQRIKFPEMNHAYS